MILMYHNIGESPGFNTVSIAHFQAQMAQLKRMNRAVISMDAYVTHVQRGTLTSNMAAITFDDAYRSFQEHALPILEAHDFPAIVFVPTSFVGKASTWDSISFPIMDWSDLQGISRHTCVLVGAHGISHKRMRQCSDAEITDKVVGAKEILEQQLGLPIHHFSYPYGQLRDFDQRCKRAVAQAGYASACSTLWGLSNRKSDLYALHRLEIEPTDDLAAFEGKISRRLHPRYFRQHAKNLLFCMGIRRSS